MAKPTGNPTGRPPKPIDWNLFEQLCNIQCTTSEIASVLKINVDTLHDRAIANYDMPYSEIYKRFAEGGKASLRRKQDKLASRNAAMAIWLGKNWLGQKDTQIEAQVTEEIANSFDKLMDQLLNLQSARKDACSNSNSEQNS